MDYEVRFIGKEWDHHSEHSGYHQLVRRLGTYVSPPNLSSIRHTWIPGRIAVMLANRSGVQLYNYTHLFHEWVAFRDMWGRRHPTIYHVLYGDESYRYLGQLPLPRGNRVVATYHQPPQFLDETIRDLHYLRSLHAIVVVSKNQIPFFSSEISLNRLYWVPHGVDTRVFRPKPEISPKKDDRQICLFVGMHKRDFRTLHDVIEIVGQNRPDVEFQVVTAKQNEPIFAGQRNVTMYCGVTEAELIGLFQRATLQLQPMLDSTANNAILEGMACGLPLVVTDVGGVRDYVDEGCAEFVSLQNAEEMATTVMRLIADSQRQKQMAGKARNRALQFDWDVVTATMRGIYDAIL